MKILKCDIRGVYGVDLDEKCAYDIGQSALIYTFRRYHEDADIKVVVGGDVRPSTVGLKEALINGISSIGGHIIDIGIVPTPVFHFANKHYHANLGIMVTASHNPVEYNGFKIDIDRKSTDEHELKEIFNIFESGKFRRGKQRGKIEVINLLKTYEDYISRKISYAGKLKVVIDAGNGTQSELAPYMFKKYGHNVIELYCTADGNFPNREPNPAIKDNLIELSKLVQNEGADLGIGFDGDGDRIAFVDNRGNYIENDRVIALFAKYFLKHEPNDKIVYDVKCSKVVADVVTQNQGIGIVEKSGHSFIRLRMIKEKALFGGELSGHFFFRLIDGEDDSLLAGLLLCKILQESGKTLADMENEIPIYFNTPDIRIPYGIDEADKLIVNIKERFKEMPIVTEDGLKILYPHGWALIRRSSTEPMLTLRFESDDRYTMRDIINAFILKVPEIRNELSDKISIV